MRSNATGTCALTSAEFRRDGPSSYCFPRTNERDLIAYVPTMSRTMARIPMVVGEAAGTALSQHSGMEEQIWLQQ